MDVANVNNAIECAHSKNLSQPPISMMFP